MHQSACHRSVTDEAVRRRGHLFNRPAPDFSAMIAMLTAVDSFCFIDKPLQLFGHARESNRVTSLFVQDSSLMTFLSEFKEEKLFQSGGLSAPTEVNIIAETLLRVRAEIDPNLPFGWAAYLARYARELQEFEINGLDVAGFKLEFEQTLALQPEMTRRQVLAELAPAAPTGGVRRLRQSVRAAISRSTLLTAVETLLRRVDRLQAFTVSGAQAGFTDIVGCAEVVGKLADLGYRASWFRYSDRLH
jgi:hypothetical protein